jgi:putative YhbY family RNA-binding protein
MMLELSSADRRALRSRAHHLRPYLSVGEAGLTPALLREIDRCLKSHELIKVRVLIADRHGRARLIEQICGELSASPIQHIGRVLVIFRPRPEETAPAATRLSAKRPSRGSGARRPKAGTPAKRFRRT